MRRRKHERARKRQRGQYMTPVSLARDVLSGVDIVHCSRILEPSCGGGAFLDAIMRGCRHAPETGRNTELVAIEIDSALVERSRALVSRLAREGSAAEAHVYEGDFFRCYLSGVLPSNSDQPTRPRHTLLPGTFDLIVGNPPFGGTFDPDIEDTLDARLGRRLGMKVKKGDLRVLPGGMHRPVAPRRTACVHLQRQLAHDSHNEGIAALPHAQRHRSDH